MAPKSAAKYEALSPGRKRLLEHQVHMKLKIDPSEKIVSESLQSAALHHYLLKVGDDDYSWGQGTETAFLDYVAPFLFNK